MQRIGTDDGLFINGNPATSTLGTPVTGDFLNAIQEELAGVIEGFGGNLIPGNNGQLLGVLMGNINSRPGHAYLSNDWCWLDKSRLLVLQWVTGVPTPTTGVVITLPLSFSGGALLSWVSINANDPTIAGNGWVGCSFLNNSQLTGWSATGAASCSYFAIGRL